jgi:hypothetical protein
MSNLKAKILFYIDKNKTAISAGLFFLLALVIFWELYFRIPGLVLALVYLNVKDIPQVKSFLETWRRDRETLAYHKEKDFPILSRVTAFSFIGGTIIVVMSLILETGFYWKLFVISLYMLVEFTEIILVIYIVWFLNSLTTLKVLMTLTTVGRVGTLLVAVAAFDLTCSKYVNAITNLYNRKVPTITLERFGGDGISYIGGRGVALESVDDIDHYNCAKAMMRHTGYNVARHAGADGVVSRQMIDAEVAAFLADALKNDQLLRSWHLEAYGVTAEEFENARRIALGIPPSRFGGLFRFGRR